MLIMEEMADKAVIQLVVVVTGVMEEMEATMEVVEMEEVGAMVVTAGQVEGMVGMAETGHRRVRKNHFFRIPFSILVITMLILSISVYADGGHGGNGGNSTYGPG